MKKNYIFLLFLFKLIILNSIGASTIERKDVDFSFFDLDNNQELSREESAAIYNYYFLKIQNKYIKNSQDGESTYSYFLYSLYFKNNLTEKVSSTNRNQVRIFMYCYKNLNCFKKSYPNLTLTQEHYDYFLTNLIN